MRALLDWHQKAADQLVQDGDRVRYHEDGARPAMPGPWTPESHPVKGDPFACSLEVITGHV